MMGQYEDADGAEKKPGLMVVLGAGNQGPLAAGDALHGLFTRNHVVYLKLHARKLFQPLIKRGFFVDIENHTTVERSTALVNHPLVTAVHLTGGKATHDAIVWGSDPKEQRRNKEMNTPILKVPMTSAELLGAVSPCWVVVPAKYTTEEELQTVS